MPSVMVMVRFGLLYEAVRFKGLRGLLPKMKRSAIALISCRRHSQSALVRTLVPLRNSNGFRSSGLEYAIVSERAEQPSTTCAALEAANASSAVASFMASGSVEKLSRGSSGLQEVNADLEFIHVSGLQVPSKRLAGSRRVVCIYAIWY